MIAAGGTGGHVYPALATAEALLTRRTDVQITFVGGSDDFARPLVEEAKLPFEDYDEVQAGPLHGVSIPQMVISLFKLGMGTIQSIGLIRKRKPDALLLTGGWVGLPVALAGRLLRVPSIIYLPDIEPGLTIRVLRRIANRVAITAKDSEVFFKRGQTVITGYPIRKRMLDIAQADNRRAQAIAHFKLDPSRKTLLVFGGSRGARTLNYALMECLPKLLEQPLQVIHITGTLDWQQLVTRKTALARQYPDRLKHYRSFPYLHDDMGLAFACADLVVCRSGASVLGELPLFSLPAILVPYPFAWRYQKVNADYLATRGAAVVMPDEDMSAQLLPTIRDLLWEHPEKLGVMRAAAAALRTDEGAWNVAHELVRLSGERA